MSLIQNRAAVAPVHNRISLYADVAVNLPDVASIVATLRPQEPLHCVRPAVIAAASRAFVRSFNGDALYAVKCNPEPAVLRAVWEGGVRHFDCASISEVTLVRRMFPGAGIHLGTAATEAPFSLFGPTCDSADVMHGPFMLPESVREGDWIEIGQLGAYGACLRTAFNGFDRSALVEVRDAAMLQTAGYEDNVTEPPFAYPRAA